MPESIGPTQWDVVLRACLVVVWIGGSTVDQPSKIGEKSPGTAEALPLTQG